MGGLAVALGALTVLGVVQLWHVHAFALLFGGAGAFDAPVRQTFVAELVGDEDLHNAVALNSTSFNAARMIGPAVSGAVIAAAGTGWAFLINAGSFLAVLASLACLRTSQLRRVAGAGRARGSFAQGLRCVRSRPDLFPACPLSAGAGLIRTRSHRLPGRTGLGVRATGRHPVSQLTLSPFDTTALGGLTLGATSGPRFREDAMPEPAELMEAPALRVPTHSFRLEGERTLARSWKARAADSIAAIRCCTRLRPRTATRHWRRTWRPTPRPPTTLPCRKWPQRRPEGRS